MCSLRIFFAHWQHFCVFFVCFLFAFFFSFALRCVFRGYTPGIFKFGPLAGGEGFRISPSPRHMVPLCLVGPCGFPAGGGFLAIFDIFFDVKRQKNCTNPKLTEHFCDKRSRAEWGCTGLCPQPSTPEAVIAETQASGAYSGRVLNVSSREYFL